MYIRAIQRASDEDALVENGTGVDDPPHSLIVATPSGGGSRSATTRPVSLRAPKGAETRKPTAAALPAGSAYVNDFRTGRLKTISTYRLIS